MPYPRRTFLPVHRVSVHSVSVLCVSVLCGILLLTSGCEPLEDGPAGAAPDRRDGQTKTVALSQLDELTVAEWASMSRYSRDRFQDWQGQGDGCDTRDVVLKRDGQGVVAAESCKIVKGTWFSVYDGVTVTDPQEIDIDHMVPLANAWRTGAAQWSDERRGEFANDLDRPQLLAVTASSNRSKGDQDPSQWKPPRQTYWCAYAQDWIAVKAYWRLSVTAKEKAALEDMLETC